eukprot:TRINITY_DN8322_c0_g1_i1.p1 TRINITY_DN8322_c0_g1~~TRINITY_DN8322_c0_g1_i1.p1  ORF type:complete len:100 (-),score=20.25 TRINITY_DN8322_c0_g1_i1:116-415(-)
MEYHNELPSVTLPHNLSNNASPRTLRRIYALGRLKHLSSSLQPTLIPLSDTSLPKKSTRNYSISHHQDDANSKISSLLLDIQIFISETNSSSSSSESCK